MNEQEANQAAVEAAEYWAGKGYSLGLTKPVQAGYVQILPDRQYPLRLHADDIALILRLEESNKKLLEAIGRIDKLVGRLYDRT